MFPVTGCKFSLVKGIVKYTWVPFEPEHLFFRWLDIEKLIHSLIISEGSLPGKHGEVCEGRIPKERPGL
jgi:hypothetical protein